MIVAVMSSGADKVWPGAFVCLTFGGVACVFGVALSSVRNWRVSGDLNVRVGRLLCLSNELSMRHLVSFSSPGFVPLGPDPVGSCVTYPVWNALPSCPLPPCCHAVSRWITMQSPCIGYSLSILLWLA